MNNSVSYFTSLGYSYPYDDKPGYICGGALPGLQNAGTLLKIPKSDGRSPQSTELKTVQGVEHQGDDVTAGFWL